MNWNHVSSKLVTLNWKYLFFFLLLCFVVYLLMFPLQEGFQEMVDMYERERKENVDGDGEGEDVDSDPKEGFQIPSSCPNVLIQNGSKFFLYNTTRMDVPGVNPIEFENLEEYVEFIKYQKKMGMNCRCSNTNKPTAVNTMAENMTLNTDQSVRRNCAVNLQPLPKPAFSST